MTRIKCSFTGGEQNKVWSNLKDYVFPFLNKEAQEDALNAIRYFYNIPSAVFPENGEFCDAEYSHILGVHHNSLPKGAKVKVENLYVDDDAKTWVAVSSDVGYIFHTTVLTSKLEKPEHLKKKIALKVRSK